jgi:hypothetical protein
MKHENLPIACCFLWLQLDQLKQNVKKTYAHHKHTPSYNHYSDRPTFSPRLKTVLLYAGSLAVVLSKEINKIQFSPVHRATDVFSASS